MNTELTNHELIDELLSRLEAGSLPVTDLRAAINEQRKEITLVWSLLDVQDAAPDLTEAQAWEVLQAVGHYHDASLGVSWETLRSFANGLREQA